MSDNPLDRIPSHDRVSLRAVIVREGQDAGPALLAAGIIDPIALPIVFCEGEPDAGFGGGFSPNLIAVLEPDEVDDDDGSQQGGHNFGTGGHEPDPAGGSDEAKAGPAGAGAPPTGPTTTNLPSAYGLKPLAPVRRRGPAR